MQQAIQEEWDKINKEDLYRLIASMRQRVRDVIEAEGGITKQQSLKEQDTHLVATPQKLVYRQNLAHSFDLKSFI